MNVETIYVSDKVENFKKRLIGCLSEIGAYHRAVVGGMDVYCLMKDGRYADLFIKIEEKNEGTNMSLAYRGDADIIEVIKSELGWLYGKEKKIQGRLKEIRTPVIETHDTCIPFVLPGLYRFYGDLFPSVLSLFIKNYSPQDMVLRVESEILNYSDMSVSTFNLSSMEEKTITHTPPLKSEAFHVSEQIDAMLRFKVSSENVILEEQTKPLKIYSHEDFLLSLEIEGETFSFAELLAAWVTPHDPEIKKLIREASDLKMGLGESGGMGHHENVEGSLIQLGAVYTTMQSRGVQYINTPISYAPGLAQRIRYPAEVLKTRSGNCIELTLTMASAAEVLGLEPVVVLVPAHAFLGVKIGEDIALVETTRIPTDDFVYALKFGGKEYDEHKKKNEIIDVIDVIEMRKKGITPNEVRG